MDIRPILTRFADDVGQPIAAGADAKVDAIVATADEALEFAHRLGVRELGTARRPLVVEVTTDPAAAQTPMYVGADRLSIGDVPLAPETRARLEPILGRRLEPDDGWLDLDVTSAVRHEVGHGVINELVPDLLSLPPREGAWRAVRYDRRIVEEAAADVFAALHARDWDMGLAGTVIRDARTGRELIPNGRATIADLHAARAAARDGVDIALLDSYRLAESSPHHFAGLLTPAFARVQEHAGWGAAEGVYVQMLARLRERSGYAIDVPTAARETVRAAHDVLGSGDETARAVRTLLAGNGALGR